MIKQLFVSLSGLKPATSIVGFSRSLLAAGTLLKVAFNNINFLIPPDRLQNTNWHFLSYRYNFFLIFNSSHVVKMQVLAIIILAIVISGYLVKITSLLQFWISWSFFMFRPIHIGVENVEMLLTLLLIPVCLFDKRKNHWDNTGPTNKFETSIQNAFLFLIKVQVAFIYYDSLHDKLFVKEWLNGTVIYYWFTHNFYGLNESLSNKLTPILTSIPVLLFLSWSTLVLEALLAIAFLFPAPFKLLLLKCAIVFHFSILLIHGFASLFFVMSAALFLYLYPSQKLFVPKPTGMKNKNELNHKAFLSGLNGFLVFYVYVFLMLIVANLLPLTSSTYFLFLSFGIVGICILLFTNARS
jgi:antimicrobial peptide system SdpB family protein